MDILRAIGRVLVAILTGISALVVVVALAILPFLNPVWVGFGQERAQAQAWTGFTSEQLQAVTGEILGDLVLGPPDFDVTLDGAPVLNERERGHMRDVRAVFAQFYMVAALAAVTLVVLWILASAREGKARYWRHLKRTGVAVAVGTVVVGVVGVAAFDVAFEIFHTVFFPAGSYLFDPRTERLVQLFPEQFWVESTIAVGGVVIALGLLLAWFARRRERAAGA